MPNQIKLLTVFFTSIFVLCACSSSKSPGQSRQYNKTNSSNKQGFPKVPKKVIPGGTGDNWRYLGKTSGGHLSIEIDDSSIASLGNNSYKFTDRKTVVNKSNFNYQNFPPYKFNISSWVIDCNKQYKITATSLFDDLGTIIKSYELTGKYSLINRNSIINSEYEYICNGRGKNVGY